MNDTRNLGKPTVSLQTHDVGVSHHSIGRKSITSGGIMQSSDVDTQHGYNWKPVRIGAGGWLTGIDIAPDGTKVVRTDTYGAYIWDGTEWRQLVTAKSMPAADVGVDNNEGVFEIRVAPSDTNRL